MMMSATRKSWRSRKSSPKSRTRSRKTHHEHHDPSQQQHGPSEHTFPEASPGREGGGPRGSPPSSVFPGMNSRHGDVADSGIDSGNGHADTDGSQARLGEHRSDVVNGRLVAEHDPTSSPERRAHRSDALATPNNSSPVRRVPDEEPLPTSNAHPSPRHRHRSKSKHRKRTTSGSEEERPKTSSAKKENSTVHTQQHRDLPCGGSASVPETHSRTDNPLSSRVSEASDSSSLSSDQAEQQFRSDDRVGVGSGSDSKRKEDADDEDEGASESEQERSDSVHQDDRKQLDAISVTSQHADRKRKLEARLEQAKSSLASPHINAMVETSESTENSPARPLDLSLVLEFRKLFQQELIRLRLELDTFRHFCCKQMETEAEGVFHRHRKHPEEEGTVTQESTPHPSDQNHLSTETRETEGQRSEGERSGEKKAVDAEEMEVWEEKLVARQKDLHEYEKEILEVESMLNQRQAICERRQSALLALDEELQSLREDIFNKKESINKDTDTSEERARKNWDLIRRHLTDKQAMLEAAVQRYKTQIASCNAGLAAKDTLIAHLQKQLRETQETVKAKEKTISQLQGKLVLASQEMHVLSTMQDSGQYPPDSDPLSHSQTLRASMRPGSGLLQRQSSETTDQGGTRRGSRRSSSTSDTAPTSDRRMSTAHFPDTGSTTRRKSTANISFPDSGMTGRKSNANLSRSLSARERRLQRARQGAGSGGGDEAVNSAACAIL